MQRILSVLVSLLICAGLVPGQTPSTGLTKQPTLYVVGYAHLDTQWRWEFPTTISEYLPNTVHQNAALLDKYPHYIFNFSGARRYQMIREYAPADYAVVKRYVAAGRWFPAGSSMEENDAISVSSESVLRQILYGNHFFRKEFGKASAEYMLPDCFGFPASLPSVLAHAGLKGFSTQKLSGAWGSAVGIPFNVGVWRGPDGRSIISALNPGAYGARVSEDISKNAVLLKRVQANGEKSGLFADYRYYGTGDVGGSPTEDSVKFVETAVTSDGPLRIISSTAEQMFIDITPAQAAKLPVYEGDLLLTQHSAGSINSQAYMKLWNRRNETLADAAERAAIGGELLGGFSYPRARLNKAWTLVMGGQFHDILPGTSTPKAYEYAWNDEVLALNQFSSITAAASTSIAARLDTRAKGVAVVVYNPLSIEREDLVEVRVAFAGGVPKAVRVSGPDGKPVPAQILSSKDGAANVLFLAKLPSVGYAVYDVAPAAANAVSTLKIDENTLENARYRVKIASNGDVSSVFDKQLDRELLASPIRLAFQRHKPSNYPAWNMDWEDQQKAPRGYVEGPAKIRIAENGPARVALEISRDAEDSHFVETIRLGAGSTRVEFANSIDWQSKEAALKATFPLSASNPEATYNWEPGTVKRANNDPKKYEVPTHQWFDLTDKSGKFGVTVLTDAKYGSDKPDDNTLRLTLIYTPGVTSRFSDQGTQDWGHHEFVYALAGHAGDWRAERSDWQALRLNQPPIAYASAAHAGVLGKSLALLKVSNPRVRAMAFKKAEDSDEYIVRLVEMDGKTQTGVHVSAAAPLISAREVNGQEQPLGAATVANGALVADLGAYQIRTFAVKIRPTATTAIRTAAVKLAADHPVASQDGVKTATGFDDHGNSLPAELLPAKMDYNGIAFELNGAQALVAKGQTLKLPAGYKQAWVLAASADSDQATTFRAGAQAVPLTIQSWTGYIGQWDNRLWKKSDKPQQAPAFPGGARRPPMQMENDGFGGFGPPPTARTGQGGAPAGPPAGMMRMMMGSNDEYAGLTPGFIKTAQVAWYASHHHTAEGANKPYEYSYLYAYPIALPAGATTLTLPDNDKVRVLAVTVSSEVPLAAR